MRKLNQLMTAAAVAAVVTFATACRDKQPEGPPLTGLQDNFTKSMRELSGMLPAPPDEIARSANALFKRMGLQNVMTHTSPSWTAVVEAQKPGGMRTPYSLKVRKNEDQGYNSFVQISVGLVTVDETEGRWIIQEICKDLNLGNSPPPSDAPPAPAPTAPDGATPSGPPPGK